MKYKEIVNTHGEFIQLPNGAHAFIDAVPNTHQCNSAGEPAYWTASGKRIWWYTVRKWAHLTWEARTPLIEEHFRRLEDPICSGSVTCSICGEAAIDQWRDLQWAFEEDINDKNEQHAGTDTKPEIEA
jgi:transposase